MSSTSTSALGRDRSSTPDTDTDTDHEVVATASSRPTKPEPLRVSPAQPLPARSSVTLRRRPRPRKQMGDACGEQLILDFAADAEAARPIRCRGERAGGIVINATTVGGGFVHPVANEPTVGQLAAQAAELVRTLNHLTRPGVGALTDPAEVCELVAEWRVGRVGRTRRRRNCRQRSCRAAGAQPAPPTPAFEPAGGRRAGAGRC